MSKTYYPVYKSSSGDVGVGTTSPTLQSNYRFLQVNGSVSAVIEATVSGTRIGGFDSTSSVLYVGTIGSYPVVFRTAVDEKMRISANGNIGIGTSSPAYKLDVNTANDSAIRIRNGGGGANNGLAFSVGSGSPWLDITEGVEFRIKGNTYANIGTWNSGNNTKLLIDSNGNIGIGTTSPTQKLDVAGSARFTNIVYAAKGILSDSSGVNPVLEVYNTVATNATTAIIRQTTAGGNGNQDIGLLVDIQGAGDSDRIANFRYYDGSTYTSRMAILRSGNVGIGTSSPSYKLDVAGGIKIGGEETLPFAIGSMYLSYNSGINRIYYGDGTGYDLRFSKRGAGATTDFVTFKDTGNVGIGTTSPATKLEVYRLESTNRTTTTDILTINADANNSPYSGHGGTILFRGGTYSGTSNNVQGNRKWGQIGMYLTDAFNQFSGENMFFAVASDDRSDTLTTAMTIQYNGNIGIGLTTPTQKLEVAGYVMAGESSYRASIYGNAGGAWIAFGTTNNTVSLGQIGAYNSLFNINSINGDTSFQYNGSEKMRITTGGNVGIGTTSPTQRLHVLTTGGSTTAPNIVATFQANTATTILAGGGTAIKFVGVSSGGNLQDYDQGMISTLGYADNNRHGMQFWVKPNASTVLTVGQTIDSNGNVGIGTTSPRVLLDLAKANNVGQVLLLGETGANIRVGFGLNPSNAGMRIFSYNHISDGLIEFGGISSDGSTWTRNHRLGLAGGNSFFNEQGGNVGIGSSSPAYKLDVTGEIRQTGNNFWFSGARIAGDGSGNIDINYNNGSSPSFTWYNGGTTALARITSVGNVGIGTTSPNAKLVIDSGEPRFRLNISGANHIILNHDGSTAILRTESNTPFTFGTNGTEKMRIAAGGSVGIGTTNPSQALEVSGTVKATSYIGDFTGRLVRTSTTQTITGNSALTIDVAAAYIHIITVQASGGTFGISSVTYNNRKAGPEVDEIILIFKWPASGSGVISITNLIGDAVDFNYGKATVVRLTSYKGTGGLWICEKIASNIDYTNL